MPHFHAYISGFFLFMFSSSILFIHSSHVNFLEFIIPWIGVHYVTPQLLCPNTSKILQKLSPLPDPLPHVATHTVFSSELPDDPPILSCLEIRHSLCPTVFIIIPLYIRFWSLQLIEVLVFRIESKQSLQFLQHIIGSVTITEGPRSIRPTIIQRSHTSTIFHSKTILSLIYEYHICFLVFFFHFLV